MRSGTLRNILVSLVPNNYYVILYIAVVLLSPMINVAIVNYIDSKQKYIKSFLILLLILSVEPTIIDIISKYFGDSYSSLNFIGRYGSQWGYSLTNFILLYICGALLKIGKDKYRSEYNTKIIVSLIIICIAILIIWYKLEGPVYEKNNVFASTAFEYCNPIVIIESILIFLVFEKLKFQSKTVNRIAKYSFMVYLTHVYIFYNILPSGIQEYSCLKFIGTVLLITIICYILGTIAGIIYHLIVEKLILQRFCKQ